MKLGTQKPTKKLPPPRVGQLKDEKKKESTKTMAKNTGQTVTIEDVDDGDEDEGTSGMPRTLRFATQLRKKAAFLRQRQTPKGARRLRQWIDDLAESASTEDKRVLTQIAKAIDTASENLDNAAALFEELSDAVANGRGTRKAGIEVGATVAIAEKHAKKYAELLVGNLEGLKVVGFRKTHAMVEYDADGDVERLLVPRAHLTAG